MKSPSPFRSLFLLLAMAVFVGCSTTVRGPDGGVVGVRGPAPGVVVDPPGPAGVAVGVP